MAGLRAYTGHEFTGSQITLTTYDRECDLQRVGKLWFRVENLEFANHEVGILSANFKVCSCDGKFKKCLQNMFVVYFIRTCGT